MIIEAKKVKEVEFHVLNYGEVFEYNEEFFMVIPNITTEEEDTYNAVDLSYGEVTYFCADTGVISHPKARLIIED